MPYRGLQAGFCTMTEQPNPYRCILDRKFIIENICITCSQDGKCDYQSIYPVPVCATVDTVERYFETLHSDSCASHSAFSTPPEGAASKLLYLLQKWFEAADYGGCLAESSVQVQKAAQAAREEVLEELDGMLMDEKLEANRLGDYRTAIAYTKLEAKIESLRQSKQKKEVPK